MLDVPAVPAMVRASKQHLTRALNNLVSNALDATKEHNAPKITGSIELLDGEVRIRVQDNGVGIAPDRLNDIFQPRFTSKKHGTGLGLTITQSVVHQLGGRIAVESELGKGTIFTLSFPAY
jgi:signal transduction histidine kinase